ncbi:MAG TPA: VOC family protein [Novosphingobium sp.]
MQSLARLGTRDLKRAKAYYDEIAATLGARAVMATEDQVSYRGAGDAVFIIGLPVGGGDATVGHGTQIGFAAPDRASVDAAYARAMELGSKSEGAPAVRGPVEHGFYNCYFRDPDGNKLLVFHSPAA